MRWRIDMCNPTRLGWQMYCYDFPIENVWGKPSLMITKPSKYSNILIGKRVLQVCQISCVISFLSHEDPAQWVHAYYRRSYLRARKLSTSSHCIYYGITFLPVLLYYMWSLFCKSWVFSHLQCTDLSIESSYWEQSHKCITIIKLSQRML